MVIKMLCLSNIYIISNAGSAQASEFFIYNHLQPPNMANFSMMEIILNKVRYFSTKSKYNFNIFNMNSHIFNYYRHDQYAGLMSL